MKAQIIAATLLISTSSLAYAADPSIPIEEPPVIAWTGFYAGINGGGAWTNDMSMTYVDLAAFPGNTNNAYAPSTVEGSASGGLAGVHAGYNWQTGPNWVVGIEGDWDWTNLSASETSPLVRANDGNVLANDTFSMETDINWLATLRGRLGYASNNWLFYATGGVALADVNSNAQVNCAGPVNNGSTSLCGAPGQQMNSSFDDTSVGATIGGGVEFKPAANWTFGVQYLYSHFSGDDFGGSWVNSGNGAPAPFYNCGVPGENCAQFSSDDIGLHTITARLSYQFN